MVMGIDQIEQVRMDIGKQLVLTNRLQGVVVITNRIQEEKRLLLG